MESFSNQKTLKKNETQSTQSLIEQNSSIAKMLCYIKHFFTTDKHISSEETVVFENALGFKDVQTIDYKHAVTITDLYNKEHSTTTSAKCRKPKNEM